MSERLIAITLLAVCTGFTFPENHYSEDRTVVKASSFQTEIYALLCDDVEDANDYSTGAHLVPNEFTVQYIFPFPRFFFKIQSKQISHLVYEKVFLLHKQLVI